MTFPQHSQPGPRPGPLPGGFRPSPQPGGFRPSPPPGGPRPGPPAGAVPVGGGPGPEMRPLGEGEDTGHPAVDAVLRSLANAARLAPAEQLAEFEAAHHVLQECLATSDL